MPQQEAHEMKVKTSFWFCVKKFDAWILYFESENVAQQAVFIRNRSGESIQFVLLFDSFYLKKQKYLANFYLFLLSGFVLPSILL